VKGKRILLAVTGSIAAYKSVFLLRLLRKAGCEVKVLMTNSAIDFVSPLTFSTLSEKPVDSDISDGEQWNNHVETGLWADAMIVAPCTANTLAKMAHGLADNVVLATYLSARCQIFVSPAMDVDMYHHPSTQRNLQTLQNDGVKIIPVEHGELASGLIGEGRMAEPETIFQAISNHLDNASSQTLTGKRFLITAGPTHEAIDPVRYIGNRSSGKMGIALAETCADRGAQVDLILGPTHLATNHTGVTTHKVISADDMMKKSVECFSSVDVAIMAAAVADYKPAHSADKKIKKSDGDTLNISLVENGDIAATLGGKKNNIQLVVGFALETNDGEKYAADKLNRKNLDFIVLNKLSDKGAGFGHDTNKITIIRNDESKTEFELKSKMEVAHDIVDEIEKLLK